MEKELTDLFLYKMELWDIIQNRISLKRTPNWTEKDFDVVPKDLKRNKARDPHGLINELFKPDWDEI